MDKIINTPIISHFRELSLPVPEHFNQSVMLRTARRVNVFALKTSLTLLCQYHDMLRAVWDGTQLSVRGPKEKPLYYFEEHKIRKSDASIDDSTLAFD